jgi:dolichol-phosphate mannosyltransferase
MKINLSETLLPVPLGDLSVQPNLQPSVYFSLIVPTYNKGENIQQIVQVLTCLLDPVLPNNYELIVVDDNSPDGTWEIAQQLRSRYLNLKVMRRQTERGLSSAVIRGWQAAQGEILGVIDGDLQHPPEVLLKLLQRMQSGADLAVASRHVEEGGTSNWSLVRRFLSRGAQLIGLIILPNVVGRVSDSMSGYFLVKRDALTHTIMQPYGYKILLEVIGRGCIECIAEVGYVFQERQAGDSKATWRQYTDYLLHLCKLRSGGRISRFRETFQIGRFLRFGLVGRKWLLYRYACLLPAAISSTWTCRSHYPLG